MDGWAAHKKKKWEKEQQMKGTSAGSETRSIYCFVIKESFQLKEAEKKFGKVPYCSNSWKFKPATFA